MSVNFEKLLDAAPEGLFQVGRGVATPRPVRVKDGKSYYGFDLVFMGGSQEISCEQNVWETLPHEGALLSCVVTSRTMRNGTTGRDMTFHTLVACKKVVMPVARPA